MTAYPQAAVDWFIRSAYRTNTFSFGAGSFGRLSRIVKAVGELPAFTWRTKQRATPVGDLAGRQVPATAMDDWWMQLPDVLNVRQVSQLLRGMLAGNLWQGHQLALKIADTWPTYRRCMNDLRTAAKTVRYKVSPFTQSESMPASDSAVAKADFVRRSFASFTPNRFAEEDAFKGMVYDLAGAVQEGVSIVELLWTERERDSVDGMMKQSVRASAWVNPRHYGVTADGSIGVVESLKEREDPLLFHSAADRNILNDERKYLVAKYKSKSGSCLSAGDMRCLSTAWLNIVYAVDWMRNFGQKYGNPFMAIPYTPGIPQSEVDTFEAAAKRCAAQGFIVYPANSLGLEPKIMAPQAITSDNPIRVMIDLAEKWCMQLLLGQTLTSDTGDGGKGGGSYALGQVHGEVKQEKLEAVADWMAEILQTQFASVLLKVNYGDTDECPTVEADFTHIESPLEAAQRIGTIVTQCKFPVVAEEAYEAIGLKEPQPGDQVIVNGQIVVQGEALTDEEKFARQLDQQVQQARASMELQAESQPQEQPGEVEASDPLSRSRLRSAIARATPEQFSELDRLVVRCQEAGGGNGELKAVAVMVKKIEQTNRIKFS